MYDVANTTHNVEKWPQGGNRIDVVVLAYKPSPRRRSQRRAVTCNHPILPGNDGGSVGLSTSSTSQAQQGATWYILFFFDRHFYFPAQLVGSFTLSHLLDKPWSQVSALLPPGTCLQLLSRTGFSIPTARRFSSNVANSSSRAFR